MRPAPNTALIYIHMCQIYTVEIDKSRAAQSPQMLVTL